MDYIIKNLEKYPLMEEQDLIKLIHQRTFGPGHLILNLDRAMDYLNYEFVELKENGLTCDCPFEEISADVVRVNLAAYDAVPEWLIGAIIATTENFVSNPEEFLNLVRGLKNYIVTKNLDYSLAKLDEYAQKVINDEHKPLHHSAKYRDAYQPHYRIIKKEFLVK